MSTVRAIYLIVCLLFSNSLFAGAVAEIHLEKSDDGQWTVTYQLPEPTTRLGFVRNPNSARTERWQADEFKILFEDQREFVVREDGQAFEQVTFNLTSTYTHLPKDYAPFSPYSDGGTLLHTARFFACADECDGSENDWPISLKVPVGEHIIANGAVAGHSSQWRGRNDGQNIYVGSQTPVETNNVIAVVDAGLPQMIQVSLQENIPALMNFFAARLGPLSGPTKPALFASYAKVKGQSTQGGVLPGQVFMHWNVDNLEAMADDEEFVLQNLWFFAHEVAHLYQAGRAGPVYPDSSEAWVHEGHADYLASQALEDLYPESKSYVQKRFNQALENCIAGLTEVRLADAARSGRFPLYYSCGLLIHDVIDRSARLQDADTYAIWSGYRSGIEKGGEQTAKQFLDVVQQLVEGFNIKKIQHLTTEKLADPEAEMMTLMQTPNVPVN